MFVLSRPAPSMSRTAVSPRTGERLFDEAIDRLLGGHTERQTVRTPAMDASETDTAFKIVLDVPGVTREQLKVSVEGRRISVETAEAPAPSGTADAERPLYRERRAARFARTVVLPAEVDQASSDAQLENGVLTLTLAKKVPAGASQLNVR